MASLMIEGISFGDVTIIGFDDEIEMYVVKCADGTEMCCHSDELSHAV